MVHILGKVLPDNYLARLALTFFYGIGRQTAHRLCARFQIYDKCRIRNLTSSQITAITAFLSSPSSSQVLPQLPLADPNYIPPLPSATKVSREKIKPGGPDPLRKLKIDSELKREIRENIAHQRKIGSYVGRRHAMGLPVRGQNTQSNAKTAKKLNRIERHL